MYLALEVAMDKATTAPQQTYQAKTTEELCKLLDRLSKEATGHKLSRELSHLIYVLKTQRLRHRKDAGAFCRAGGVVSLVRLLSVADEVRELCLLLAVLANVCSLDIEARKQVMDHGLEQIVKILQESSSPDVINTAARCLANLGLTEAHIPTLQQRSLIDHLTRHLARDDRSLPGNRCRQSLLRCLRIVCSAPECRDELKLLDGVGVVVDCLTCGDEEVVLSALQTLEVLMTDSDPDTMRPLYQVQAVQNIIRYCSHAKPSVRQSAIVVLLNCTKSSDGRVALSSAGGVETLVAAMEQTAQDSSMFHSVVCGTCVCCREVICRQRLRDCGGLRRLIKMLSAEEHSGLYSNIMTALVCYYFDETSLKVMVREMGLLAAIKYHLELIAKASTAPAVEVEDQHSENMSESDGEGEMMDGGDMAVVSSAEIEDSDIARSSSSTSAHSVAKTNKPSSSLTESSSQLCSMGAMRAEPSLSCPHPQQEDTSAQLPSLEEDISPTTATPPVTSNRQPRLQVDLELSSPMPANYLDSLLASPNPYQKESKVADSAFVSDQHPPLSSQIILMLSRVSHLRDCLKYLSSPEMLPAIFSYFAAVKPPDFHVFKVLTRIFTNPDCFQDSISCLAPSKIYQLLRVSGPTAPEPAIVPCLSPTSGLDFVSMCHSLLERLSRVAESPYGQGVLAHSLLRGSDSEKATICLALPLLCRSPRLCQRMMLGYGGFSRLSDLVRDDGDDVLQAMALDSLLQLARTVTRPATRKRQRSHSISDDTLPPSKLPRRSSSYQEPLLPLSSHASAGPRNTMCRYMDHDHSPFDMIITINNEGSHPLSIQVHKSILLELSDVFAVMLGGQYLESSRSEVHLHKIPPLAFLSVIHHAYGCGWQCSAVMERVMATALVPPTTSELAPPTTSEESNFTSEKRPNLSLISDLLISKVVDKCEGEREKKLATHCLQVLSCAGMFLLPDLVTLCQHKAVSYLVPENVSAMFRYAELHWSMCLAESCIRSVINLPHSQERTEILKDIVESPQGSTALDIIKVFLQQFAEF